ncbi:hypothetical protein CVT26_000389 [Gymnopilus dilepis]|uniref:Uncharacterized protein n=1 Tax=Gymnopilus dilepis TaxID=231916 RepID=A0A409VHR4_9AGAR|nr:hypothetical protein CVT26_000389 [Gymnopilus dilepis]
MSDLSGTWKNELGSTMTLTADGAGGLTGSYNSAVGKAEDFYILTGRYDASAPVPRAFDKGKVKGTSLGWVVTYRNSKLNAHSTATWSGQYFGGADEKIVVQWLLTTSSTTDSAWSSTNVGTNTFRRSSSANSVDVSTLKYEDEKSTMDRPAAVRKRSLRIWTSPIKYLHTYWNKMLKRYQ